MSRLAETNRVLYVESVGLRTPTWAPQDRSRIARRLAHYLRGPRVWTRNPNLYVLSPFLIPYYQSEAVRNLNAKLLLRQVQNVRHQLDMHHPILWSYVPNAYALVGHIQEKMVVYHCVDDLASVAGVPKDAVSQMEQRFIRKADAIFTTSQKLFESRQQFNPHTYYFSNVADAAHFGKALGNETVLPRALKAIHPPIAGYVGAMDAYKVDFNLLAEVAKLLPDWAFVLIGPIGQGQPSTSLGELGALSNVHLLGHVPYEEIPAYLKGFDVALIPHLLSDYTSSSFPMKLYEYLAAGRPVVATPLSAIQHVDLVSFARTPKEFASAIVAARRDNSRAAEITRAREAQQHTWESRIQDFDTVLSNICRTHTRDLT